MTDEIEKIGKVTSASVHKGTGKTWSQWIARLEKCGARGMTHQEIVVLLKKKYRLSTWWQQGVTTGFEMYIGRKVEGRNAKGEYSTMVSRTFPLSNKALWKFLDSNEGQNIWLKPLSKLIFKTGEQFEVEGGVFGELRTLRTNERLRLRWQDEDWKKPSILQVQIIPRNSEKCVLVFHHEQLPSEKARMQLHARWKGILSEILGVLK